MTSQSQLQEELHLMHDQGILKNKRLHKVLAWVHQNSSIVEAWADRPIEDQASLALAETTKVPVDKRVPRVSPELDSFGAMLTRRKLETLKSLDRLNVTERYDLYARFIEFFGYQNLLGDDVPRFNPGWTSKQLMTELFGADPIVSLFEFLLSERLISDTGDSRE